MRLNSPNESSVYLTILVYSMLKIKSDYKIFFLLGIVKHRVTEQRPPIKDKTAETLGKTIARRQVADVKLIDKM